MLLGFLSIRSEGIGESLVRRGRVGLRGMVDFWEVLEVAELARIDRCRLTCWRCPLAEELYHRLPMLEETTGGLHSGGSLPTRIGGVVTRTN